MKPGYEADSRKSILDRQAKFLFLTPPIVKPLRNNAGRMGRALNCVRHNHHGHADQFLSSPLAAPTISSDDRPDGFAM